MIYRISLEKLSKIKTLVILFIVLPGYPSEKVSTKADCDISDSINSFCANYPNDTCRISRFNELKCDIFYRLSCTLCYTYGFTNTTRPFVRELIYLKEIATGKLYEPDTECKDSIIYKSFNTEFDKRKWKECCEDARQCCSNMMKYKTTLNEDKYCPRTWDGWSCFNNTPANSKVEIMCPIYPYAISAHSTNKYAFKVCDSNGSWFLHESFEWTNYTECSDTDSLLVRIYVNIGAHFVSTIVIIPALILLFAYKKLRMQHIRIHRQFLISLLFHGVMRIASGFWFINNAITISLKRDPVTERTCIALHVITEYFRLATFLWMFCEGFYLHQIIFVAFGEWKHSRLLYIIGWCFPALFVAIYAGVRTLYDDDKCWIQAYDNLELIIRIPGIIAIVANLIFLLNILRIIISKIRADMMLKAPDYFKQAVRSTLMLLPLFGLQMIFTIYRPNPRLDYVEAYFIIDYIMEGLQGFTVALLFCYLNHEVLNALKMTYRKIQARRVRHPPLDPRRSLCSFISSTTINNSPQGTDEQFKNNINQNTFENKATEDTFL